MTLPVKKVNRLIYATQGSPRTRSLTMVRNFMPLPKKISSTPR